MTTEPATNATSQDVSASQAAEFLLTIFETGDRILIRPLETWVEGDRKRSAVDYRGVQYIILGHKNTSGKWLADRNPSRLTRKLAQIIERSKEAHANIFFGVCPRLGGNGQYDLVWQIRTVRALWADVDDTGDPCELLARCDSAGLPHPSIVIHSGNGLHAYWLLSAPYHIDDVDTPPAVHVEWIDEGGGKRKPFRFLLDSETGEKLSIQARQNIPQLSAKAQHLQDIMAGIASRIGGDHTQDLSRLLRVPGTLNRKDERNGREPILCRVVECDRDRRYAISDFERFTETSPARTQRDKVARVKLPAPRKITASKQDKFNNLLLVCDAASPGVRSEADFALVCYAIESGMLQEAVWAACQGVGKFAEGGERYLQRTWGAAENHTRERIFNKAKAKSKKPARGTVGNTARNTDDTRPDIIIDTDEPRVVNEAIAALSSVDNFFQRGGLLMHVVRDAPPPRGIDRPKDAPRISRLKLARLRELMAASAFWKRPVSEDEVEPCHPPEWAVKAVDARGQWPEVRRIESVVETPVLRADGTIVQNSGYDRESGLLYEPQAVFPQVPDQPTRADAERARDELLDVVADFPFGQDTHRSAWLSGVLTPFARLAFHGPAPLHLFDANVRGSGKSLLADVTGVIAFGRDMARMTLPSDDDEFRKRITALAIAGEPSVLLDNVTGTLGGSSLDAALTAVSWSDRVLGRSEMAVSVPLFITWFATGNNVVLAADTTRRTLHVRLESPEENPEERSEFDHPELLKWVKQERSRLVIAALTILRAYTLAGRPGMGLKPWGSFEAWSDLVRQAIVWCGASDPGEARQALAEESDLEAVALRQLIDGWAQIDLEGHGLTVAAVLDAIESHHKKPLSAVPAGYDQVRNAITELMPSSHGRFPSSRSVGMKLNHLRRRVIDGRCMDKKPNRHGNYWLVRSVSEMRTAGTERSSPPHPYAREKNTSHITRALETGGNNAPSALGPQQNPSNGNGSHLAAVAGNTPPPSLPGFEEGGL